MTSSVFRTIKPKDIWLGDHFLRRNGTSYKTKALAPEMTVDNAQQLIKQLEFEGSLVFSDDSTISSDYNQNLKNCESLAFWCKTSLLYDGDRKQIYQAIGKPLTIVLKEVGKYLIKIDILPYLKENTLPEMIDKSLNTSKDIFYSTLVTSGLASALASVILEFVKVLFAYNQLRNETITFEEFRDKIISNIITALTVGTFSIAIHMILMQVTLGTATFLPHMSIAIGKIIGVQVGQILGRQIVKRIDHSQSENQDVKKIDSKADEPIVTDIEIVACADIYH
ncbi:unnamed protein product [Rotaria magnacalcarata]|uniref:Uncharacterized protein n=1 Tax=Rotaria magnacalcarata TaxID=392030 RepID=A0A8S2SWI8_9BILA|nr:unnamed protein product [Rotaria magnacalcarata]